VAYLKKNVHPLDLAFRLAENHGIVLLNGGGFEAPDWSLRVSLANLPEDVYDDIGGGSGRSPGATGTRSRPLSGRRRREM
jgi:aspartate 4-decarboxylase